MAIDGDSSGNLAFGDFIVDRADERLLGPGGPVRLGHKAFRVLVSLIEHEGRLLTKDALFSSVWDGTIVTESALTSAVKELRRALGDDTKPPRYIESVYGRGYRFIAPVRAADGAPPSRPAERRERAPEADRASIAEGRPPLVLVTAFQDDAVRERHPHCGAGIREEVLSSLARFREIQLVADDRPDEEASRKRRSERGYQLSATLLPDGDGVKVIARANRLNDGLIVWAESMSLADTGTAGGVEKIVRRIVGSALPAVDEDLFLGLPRETGDFYDNYLIAKRRSLTARTFAEAKAAAEVLEAIIAERPDFALAYPPLARLYNTDFGYTGLGSTGPKERAHALRLAKQGLAADRGNVHAYTLLGFCYLWNGERNLARSYVEQALALNPYNHVRLQEAATAYMYMGDLAGARALMDRAAELNQLADDGFLEDFGRLHLIEGDFEAAHAALGSILHNSIWSEMYLAICELRLGLDGGRRRFLEWRERVERCWHSRPPPSSTEMLGWIRRHNPFPADASERFFDGVEAALGQQAS